MSVVAKGIDRSVCDLEWLVLPNEDQRQSLKSLLAVFATDNIDDANFLNLRTHANFAWGDAETRRIGKLGQKIASECKFSKQRLQSAGFVRFSLLIIASKTVSHMKESLSAAALRYGIALFVDCIEYQDAESAIAAHPRDHRYNAVWLAMDFVAWGLETPIGDEAASLSYRNAALDRASRLGRQISESMAPLTIYQTLPREDELFHAHIDIGVPGTLRHASARFNIALADRVLSDGHAMLDLDAIADLCGTTHWRAGRYSHMAKFPFAPTSANLVADNLVRIVAARIGKSRRVLVLDLDNTLWSGIIGDAGLEGIEMSMGNPIGEAHRAVQKVALNAHSRGIILCIASKNTHDIAIEAFRKHPDMLIPESAISVFKINWQDKAGNIRAMAKTLDLGLESFVFVDDNPAERLQVRTELPQVAVPELPQDVSNWPHILSAAGYFEQASITVEDMQRASYYAANAQRAEILETTSDIRTYLASLDMELSVRSFDAMGRPRIAQLIAKSNQFNLTTKRYSEKEVEAIEADTDTVTLQFRLMDRFGDNGMISAIIASPQDDALHIDLWIMSCRVLSRNVEHTSLNILVSHARARGFSKITGTYIPSARNRIVQHHYEKLGFSKISETDDNKSQWCLEILDYQDADVPMRIIAE